MPCSYLVRGDGVEPSLSRCRDVLPLHYNHMRPVCPGVKRPVSALPHSCRMMLRPRFVVECAGAGRPLCPGPGAAGWNRTTSHTGRILSISPVAAFCRIWHRHASQNAGAVQLSARGRGGRVGAAPGVANGPRTRNPRLGRPMLCLIELLPHVGP